MQKLFFTFIATLVVLAIFSSAGARFARGDNAGLEIRSEYLADDELHLIIETYRSWWPLLSHSPNTADAKGYLVSINLASKKPLAERTRVIGPIWDVPNSRSSISFQAGVTFTKEDANAASATPLCKFEADGTLLRLTPDIERKLWLCDVLTIATKDASWKPSEDVPPVPDHLRPGSEDRVISNSQRYILLYQNDTAECFDLFTGKRHDAPWLTQRFADERSIKNFKNVAIYLTDDLRYLVVSPRSIWNNSQGTIFETFEFEGKTYNRAETALIYSRPSEKPLLLPRKFDKQKHFLSVPPDGAFSIDGKLFLFERGEELLRLYTPDGQMEIVANPTADVSWGDIAFSKTQLVQAADQLVLIGTNSIFKEGRIDETVCVIRWNYSKNTVTRDEVPIKELFEQQGKVLRPKSVLPIK